MLPTEFMDYDDANDLRITGVMMQYYTACKTELWYFANHISYNDEDENIKIGRVIHEQSFNRQKKNISIDNTISIDYIKSNSANGIVVHEIKKSSKLVEPVRMQVLYYLWYLKKKGISNSSAIITYPKERRKEVIHISASDESTIENILSNIKQIVKEGTPPQPMKKPYCKKCSYYHLCWC
ncbi:MAG: CRISPR-associated protein Cas4 [Nitrososphaeraceae archaeon]